MNLDTALVLYAIIVLAFIIFFVRIGIKTFSAIVMSLIIGQIILNFIIPPYCIDPWECQNSSTAIYYLIQVISPIVAVVYIFYKGLRDNKKYNPDPVAKIP